MYRKVDNFVEDEDNLKRYFFKEEEEENDDKDYDDEDEDLSLLEVLMIFKEEVKK